jgi:hypothetical protein
MKGSRTVSLAGTAPVTVSIFWPFWKIMKVGMFLIPLSKWTQAGDGRQLACQGFAPSSPAAARGGGAHGHLSGDLLLLVDVDLVKVNVVVGLLKL